MRPVDQIDPKHTGQMYLVESLCHQFMSESNAIEGEHLSSHSHVRVYVDAVLAGRQALQPGPAEMESIVLEWHLKLGEGRLGPDAGRYRLTNVRVGNYTPPGWGNVPNLMAQFWHNFGAWNSWTAHNNFEDIHPFVDLNGRIGRLLWLYKAVQEGWWFKPGFLHMYYYQTLQHQR